MHDSEQEHSGITGCRVTYESTIFYNEANKFSIIVVKTNDPRIPLQACSDRYYGDRMLRFTAVGYELPRTKAVELELDGEWVESKYGYQLQVEQWQEIVPQTADGLLAYLGSGLIKGIGPKTAEDIVATFGPDTLNILDNEPEKLLQIRGITEGKLKDIEESYAESRVLRNLMSLLGPFKITPATALKIYQHFGPACVDILKKCPYDLCQISGFGFKRVDGIVRKTDNRLHSTERIKGAVLYTLEDARSKSGHLFLPSEDLVKETLLLLNAPIPIPEQRVRTEEVQETLQQMILHGAVVAYKLNALRITEKMAIFEAKVYRDREDAEPLSSYVANCTLDATPGGLYVEAAQEEALDTALSNAGFGIQFADVGSESEEYGSEVPVGAKAEIAKPVQTKVEVAEPVQKQPESVKATPQESAKTDPLDAIMADDMPVPEQVTAEVVEKPKTVVLESVQSAQTPPEPTQNVIVLEQEPPAAAYTQSSPVEEIRRQMTYEQAQNVIVDCGTCKGWTLAQVADRRPASLRWYVKGYQGENNILRAAAAIIWDSLQEKQAG